MDHKNPSGPSPQAKMLGPMKGVLLPIGYKQIQGQKSKYLQKMYPALSILLIINNILSFFNKI